jgi:hypothetical protein
MALRYITDKKLAEMPSVMALEEGEREKVIEVAERVYAYVQENPMVTQNDLQQHAEDKSWPLDRFNAAVQLLVEQRRLHPVDVAMPQGGADGS